MVDPRSQLVPVMLGKRLAARDRNGEVRWPSDGVMSCSVTDDCLQTASLPQLETHVKSNMPAGYGGHVPTTRHDVLHRNTQFDERLSQLETDPNRDTFGGFTANLVGVPYLTKNPR